MGKSQLCNTKIIQITYIKLMSRIFINLGYYFIVKLFTDAKYPQRLPLFHSESGITFALQ